MAGGGTTLIECRLTGRKGIGIDINPSAVNITKERLSFGDDSVFSECEAHTGDARNLKDIANDSIDLIVTHPPYSDIIRYSDGKIDGDL